MKTLSSIIESMQKPNGFAILKPGFLKYEDEFLTLLKNNNWRVINRFKGKLTKEQTESLYKMHIDKPFYRSLVDYMCSDECLCCLCVKKCDDPIKDMSDLKDKVRKSWGEDDMKNAMHSSDSIENVERESKICCNRIIESSIFPNISSKHVDDTINDVEAERQMNISIINMLETLFAEEIIAWYQYLVIQQFLHGPERTAIQEKYLEFAKDEYEDHAMWLLKRIEELGGFVNQDILKIQCINDLAVAKAFDVTSQDVDVEVSLRHNIDAELNAIEHYKQAEEFTRGIDVVTNKRLKAILEDEQEHLSELKSLLTDVLNVRSQPILPNVDNI